MTAPDKARAAVHYPALAAEAALSVSQRKVANAWEAGQAAIAELAAWKGTGLTPGANCDFHRTSLGAASVLIEYSNDEDGITIVGVLLNGQVCEPVEVVPESVIEQWSAEVAAAVLAEARQQRDDRSCDEGPDATERDRWADAACDRWERDIDARHGA